MIRVDLTWPEIMIAINAGVMRRINAVKNGREEPYGERPTAFWNHDINGCLAEIAVAKHYNIFWSGTVGRIDLPDVGELQIRSKAHSDERLVILPSDGDYAQFVSVIVGLPTCFLAGWLFGRAGKIDEWIVPEAKTGRTRYFVPNKSLMPMDALRETFDVSFVNGLGGN